MTVSPHTPEPLTTRQRDVLEFEARWYRNAGAKQQAIRDELGLTETRYYQVLAKLVDHPEAARAQPALVSRLRRARERRRAWRGTSDG
ncbi:DUF3263 domain-containing protein [Stackebrandtia endophytica]|uniref:DUF3263 domain-containing protein n=1 Tax=Stackebrandtia endophytica TaxID=1496996 RepID=UPI0014776E4E